MIIDDKYMVYDLEEHLYIPTKLLFKDKLNLDLETWLNGQEETEIYLKDIAYFIKDYCIEYGTNYNYQDTKKRIEYLIFSNTQGERNYLQRAYVEFVRYAKNDEGDLVGLQSGIKANTIIPIDELRGKREVSSRLERILKQSGLLFRGERVWIIPTEYEYGVDY